MIKMVLAKKDQIEQNLWKFGYIWTQK